MSMQNLRQYESTVQQLLSLHFYLQSFIQIVIGHGHTFVQLGWGGGY